MKLKYLESKRLSWLLFFTCFILFAVVYMTKNMFSAAMASIVEEGIMTKTQTGAINGAFWTVYAIFQVIGGFIADKFSPYKLVGIGLGGAVIANLVIYINQDYWVIMAAWVFSGIIQFGLWPGIFKIISTQVSPSLRSTSIFWMAFTPLVRKHLPAVIR